VSAPDFAYLVHPRSRLPTWLATMLPPRSIGTCSFGPGRPSGVLVDCRLAPDQFVAEPALAGRRVQEALAIAGKGGIPLAGLGEPGSFWSDLRPLVARPLRVVRGERLRLTVLPTLVAVHCRHAGQPRVWVSGADRPFGRRLAVVAGRIARDIWLDGADRRRLEETQRAVLRETGLAAHVGPPPVPVEVLLLASPAAIFECPSALLVPGTLVVDFVRPRGLPVGAAVGAGWVTIDDALFAPPPGSQLPRGLFSQGLPAGLVETCLVAAAAGRGRLAVLAGGRGSASEVALEPLDLARRLRREGFVLAGGAFRGHRIEP